MATITNHLANAQLINLDDKGRKGPYLVAQRGTAPGDMTLREGLYFLTRGGKWADVVSLGALASPDMWNSVLFDDSGQVLSLLDSLGASSAEVEPLAVSADAIAAWLSGTAGLDPMQRIKNLINVYRNQRSE